MPWWCHGLNAPALILVKKRMRSVVIMTNKMNSCLWGWCHCHLIFILIHSIIAAEKWKWSLDSISLPVMCSCAFSGSNVIYKWQHNVGGNNPVSIGTHTGSDTSSYWVSLMHDLGQPTSSLNHGFLIYIMGQFWDSQVSEEKTHDTGSLWAYCVGQLKCLIYRIP